MDDTCLIRINQISRHWWTSTPPSFWESRCQQIGGAAARPVHLVGRQQTQESDNLYYVCMQSVAVTGIKVEPTLAEYLRHASDWARETRDDALARCLVACADRPRD